jgi:hypothetical protein
MVSVPTVGWMNAAHVNGTAVLGTFILEWKEGAKVCNELFASEQTAVHAAKQLASIASWFGFEGWLVRHPWPFNCATFSSEALLAHVSARFLAAQLLTPLLDGHAGTPCLSRTVAYQG